MRFLVAASAALALAAPAQAAYRSTFLEQKAQAVRGTSVTVWCETDQQTWDANLPAGTNGVTYADIQEIILSPQTCNALQEPLGSQNYDVATAVFLHELVHTTGMTNEAATDCWAMFLLRYELRHWWGYTKATAETAYQRAWAIHLRFAAKWGGTCAEGKDRMSPANGLL